ncbi:condensation domain-containing protein [Streptomyces sp. NPDC102405]|uniref:condensation domain-containing protein n=1 Tax=Streptomyces sp. NPDC102405 TaxID=3366170 RepID=UPI0037FF6D15
MTVTPGAAAGAHPLSTGQEALWLAHRLDPDSSAYNVVLAVRLRGALRVDVLQEALTALVARHELLRSRFPGTDDGPVRRVDAPGSVRLDVREAPGADDAELFRLATLAGEEPFRLTAGAFRAVLLRRSATDTLLVTVTHHIVSDATSQWLLMRDLFTEYGARTEEPAAERGPGAERGSLVVSASARESDPAHRPGPLAGSVSSREPGPARTPGPVAAPALARGSGRALRPRPEVGWDEQVRAERDFLGSVRGARAGAYWREACAGLRAAVLPLDRPRPPHCTLRGATHEVGWHPDTARRLREAAAGSGLTPFAWLLGTFQAALHRSGCGDGFLIGCPATTRFTPDTRQAVGYYVNALPIAARFTPVTTLLDTIGSAQDQLRRGLAHARYPVELLGGGPLFRISCTLVVADRLPVEGLYEGPVPLGGLRAELVDVPQQEGQLDLTVEILQDSRGFKAVLRYRTDLFDAATVERFGETWRRLLDVSLDAPDTAVSDVGLVAHDDLAFLLALGSGAA